MQSMRSMGLEAVPKSSNIEKMYGPAEPAEVSWIRS